ncbi:hypothetical protein DICVIV_04750 [Dictyocaulus viviparus]|uniref:Chondroitin proteoglycan 4 domain-containing protein n=1 Tax=Dictyocaulus viviparus TaxID=29172 RepID=A0A0D8XX84_DICVI|nr:hypothetical protein DICVIV_04750 [Dictyocaulus viviparus]
MIVWLIAVFVTNVNGAVIPLQPVIPTTSACLQGCFESGSVVNAAFDLLNFKSIAVDIENFCSINTALLKCGRECPSEQIWELEARTYASSFVCGDKIEEFRLVSGCLEGAEDVTLKCSTECRMPTVNPLRLDSSPAASVNPTVFLDGIAETCKKQVCVLRCAQSAFNKECAGAGDLFRDLARHQVKGGIDTLLNESTNKNITLTRLMTENYVKNLPNECAFYKDIDEFEKIFETSAKNPLKSESTTLLSRIEVVSTQTSEESHSSTESSSKEASSDMFEEHTNNDEKESSTTSRVQDETTAVLIEEEEHSTGTPDHEVNMMSTSASSINEDEEKALETSSATTDKQMEKENFDEDETALGMDVNAIEETSPSPTESVIVVDNTSEDLAENSIQAGIKEEVKSSSYGVVISEVLFVAVATMLLV